MTGYLALALLAPAIVYVAVEAWALMAHMDQAHGVAVFALIALAIAWVAREAWRAPTVYEDRCPCPELLMERRGGGLECAGPCVDRPPCREGRG
jgi:hypothetical protein